MPAALVLNNLTCYTAEPALLTTALTALRASPLAAIYNGSKIVDGTTCASLNFTASIAKAPSCFSPAVLHFKPLTLPSYFNHTADDANYVEAHEEANGASVMFDYVHGLPNGTAAMRAGCACFTGSDVCNAMAVGACAAVPGHECNRTAPSPRTPVASAAPLSSEARVAKKAPATAAVEERAPATSFGSHVPDSGLLCNEGPLEFMRTVMVPKLQNGSLAALHQLDGVVASTCASRGFVRELITPGQGHNGTDDHCYPPATIWFKKSLFSLEQMLWIEDGALPTYDAEQGVPAGTAHRMATCACLPNSTLRQGLPAGYCDGKAQLPEGARVHVSVPALGGYGK
jgi:hypothetical protein